MNKLLTKSLQEGNIDFVLQIPPNLLSRQETKWFVWCKEYFQKFGVAPSLERFCNEFSDFVEILTIDPLEDVYENEVASRRNSMIRDWILSKSDEIRSGKDPYAELKQFVDSLSIPSSEIIDGGNVDLSLFTEKSITYKTGFQTIDERAGGFSRGDLVYIFGRPGSGKTSLLISLVCTWITQGINVTLISNEIRYDDILFRVYAQIAGVDISGKRGGTLTSTDVKRLLIAKNFLVAHRNLTVVKHPVKDVNTLTSFISKETQVLAIDGAYLMSKSPDWKDLTNVSNTLKNISNSYGITIVGVIQANRAAAEKTNLENVAGSDSFTQDADIIIGVNPAGLIEGGRIVNLLSSKNRHGIPVDCALNITFPIVRMWE